MNKRTVNQAEINIRTSSSYSFIANMITKYGETVIRKAAENSTNDTQKQYESNE